MRTNDSLRNLFDSERYKYWKEYKAVDVCTQLGYSQGYLDAQEEARLDLRDLSKTILDNDKGINENTRQILEMFLGE